MDSSQQLTDNCIWDDSDLHVNEETSASSSTLKPKETLQLKNVFSGRLLTPFIVFPYHIALTLI